MRRYDISATWRENLQHAPVPADVDIPLVAGDWTYCGLPVNSPLGIAAGPLLNGDWLLYYASLGFDVLVYKTVRSQPRECYELPNLVPVPSTSLAVAGSTVAESTNMDGTWAVSFGMPSLSPDEWRADVERCRAHLAPGKLLVVSVVGAIREATNDPTEALNLLADDFADCARWAAESGAHAVEANFSCPNVATRDGQLYQQPEAAELVAKRIRAAIPGVPLVLKIGRVPERMLAEDLVRRLAPVVDGLAMTNAISAHVRSTSGTLHFDGNQRGICGRAIRDASIEQIRMFGDLLQSAADGPDYGTPDLIGVGGICTGNDVQNYLSAGASTVALATSAMIDPGVGIRIRRDLQSGSRVS